MIIPQSEHQKKEKKPSGKRSQFVLKFFFVLFFPPKLPLFVFLIFSPTQPGLSSSPYPSTPSFIPSILGYAISALGHPGDDSYSCRTHFQIIKKLVFRVPFPARSLSPHTIFCNQQPTTLSLFSAEFPFSTPISST